MSEKNAAGKKPGRRKTVGRKKLSPNRDLGSVKDDLLLIFYTFFIWNTLKERYKSQKSRAVKDRDRIKETESDVEHLEEILQEGGPLFHKAAKYLKNRGLTKYPDELYLAAHAVLSGDLDPDVYELPSSPFVPKRLTRLSLGEASYFLNLALNSKKQAGRTGKSAGSSDVSRYALRMAVFQLKRIGESVSVKDLLDKVQELKRDRQQKKRKSNYSLSDEAISKSSQSVLLGPDSIRKYRREYKKKKEGVGKGTF